MRRVTVMLDQQPQSKNIKPADAEAFRTSILDRIESFGQTAFRGDVLLQMDFFTSSKDPPAIYSLPKSYIDLLWKHGKVIDSTRPRVLTSRRPAGEGSHRPVPPPRPVRATGGVVAGGTVPRFHRRRPPRPASETG